MPLLLPLLALTPLAAQMEVQLFDGKSLDGWTGDAKYWSVQDGHIVGKSTPENPCDKSTYLFWDGEASNFELTFEYKIIGGNSGVQYRSQRHGDGDVAGYQADIEAGPNYSGILYESNGRGIMATRGSHFELTATSVNIPLKPLGDAAELQKAVLHEDWNYYRIVADGPRLIHEINGTRMIDVVDRSAQSESRGTFALQLHAGPPMEVRFKDFNFRALGSSFLLKEPEWIWAVEDSHDNEVRYFAHSFWLDEPARLEHGAFTTDNSFKLWVNGTEVAAGDNWEVPTPLPRELTFKPGWNLVAVEAKNLGGPAATAGYIHLTTRSGVAKTIATEEGWKTWDEQPDDWKEWTSPAGYVGATPMGWPSTVNPLTDEMPTGRTHGPVSASSGPWGNVFRKSVAPAPRDFEMANGLICERIYSAQVGDGSWASMTFGDNGVLYVSPERGRILRFDWNGAMASQNHTASVFELQQVMPQTIDLSIGSAQGMEWAHDSLYVNVAGKADGGGGLHRLRDSDGDGRLDFKTLLARYGPPSEHGAHGIRVGPDGMLYLIHGNYTEAPLGAYFNPLTQERNAFENWQEDVLLPRIWDPRGHAHNIMAPAAVLWRTNADGTQWERIAGGMRNPYDIAISQHGEIFTYDADMEWDLGTPWYRPPRVLHLTPGAEFGWRSGSAKWMADYPDAVPALTNTDLSSPTGIELLEGSRFPLQYQSTLLLGDWAWGRILSLDLQAEGASYRGALHSFIEGRGLTVTDLEIGPDGWLWFITGGRGTQSGLYRVRHAEPSSLTGGPTRAVAQPPLLEYRRKLEDWQPSAETTATDLPSELLFGLHHADTRIQTTARLALERAFTTSSKLQWKNLKPLIRRSNASTLQAAIAWLRTRPAEAVPSLSQLYAQKDGMIALRAQPSHLQRMILRSMMLIRLRGKDQFADNEELQANWQTIRGYLSPQFPLDDPTANRMLAELLVHLQAPDLPSRFLDQIDAHPDQQNQLFYATLLRLVERGWTPELRLSYFYWLHDASQFQGGASLQGFLNAISSDAQQRMTSEEWLAMQPELERHRDQQLEAAAASANTAKARSFHREWTTNDALAAVETQMPEADASRGADVFRQALCIQCRRFDQQGGYLGPDLTASGRRFLTRDLLQAVIEPEWIKSDQYANISMPPGLLNTWKAQDLADLILFLEGGVWP